MAYVQANSPFKKLKKTTKGKGRHFLTAKEGEGMTAAGRKAYNRETGGNLKAPQPGGGKRRTSYCARSRGQMKMHNINCIPVCSVFARCLESLPGDEFLKF